MEFSKCVNQVNCKYLPFASQRQIALLVGRFSLVKGHWQNHSLLSVYSSFPHFFNSDRMVFFHINLTPIEQEQGLVQHPRPRLWTNWRENGTETRFLSPSQCKGTVSFWLKNWFWRFIVKLLARNDPLHLVGVRHLVLEKNHHHGLWPRLLGSRNSEYKNYFHSLLSEGAPEKIAAASDFPWADAWRFLGWLHKWQVGCGKLF